MKNSDYIIAQSTNTKNNAIKFYSPNKDIKVIPLGYESSSFKKVNRKNLGLEEDIIYTISVGRIIKRKGYDFLIKSIAKLNNPKVHALIIGNGPEKESLQKLSKELNIGSQINFLGMVSEEKKFQYLSVSDIYILSSVHEGFGIVLQEAMQVGLPIVATDNGGQVDFINDGQNGFLIRFGDDGGMKNSIERILGNRNMKMKMSKENKKKVKEFGLGKIAKGYLEVVNGRL